MNRKIAASCCALLVAGCSSSGSPAKTTSPSRAYRPAVGADAGEIAAHLPGCTGLAAGDVGKGAPAMASTATCTLEGHVVIVDSFASPAELDGIAALSKGHEMYYASGATGWLAFIADQGATPATTTLQEQLTNDAGALFKESTDGDPFPAAPIAAQKTLTALIAKRLGGAVGHVS